MKVFVVAPPSLTNKPKVEFQISLKLPSLRMEPCCVTIKSKLFRSFGPVSFFDVVKNEVLLSNFEFTILRKVN